MHITVLGAGVVGVTTAYYLLESGHEVTIIDRAADVASGCSFANGAQLSYSYVDAMANPALLTQLPGILLGLQRGFRFRPPLGGDVARWGTAFLGQCTARNAAANTLANLELARRSRQLLDDLEPLLRGNFDHREAGKLVLMSTRRDLDNAERGSALKARFGSEATAISLDEAVELEPAIAHLAGNYVGAVWSPGDGVGDAHRFATALARLVGARPGCRMMLDTAVEGLVVKNNQLEAVATNRGLSACDAAVVCLGAWSPGLLRPLGVRLPIVPVRGYSFTLPPGPHATSISLTDFSSRFVISRVGERIRIAGFADFVGFDTSRDARRQAALFDLARQIAPRAASFDAKSNHPWGGFRPLTPNGQPIIGPTRIGGVYLNTGHGSLGWTLACASGEKIARQLSSGEVAALAA